MRKKNKILFVIFLFCSIIAKSQDKVYIPYFQFENIYWEYQIRAAKMFNKFLDSNNRYLLVLPELKNSVYPIETFTQTITNAKVANAKYFIIGKMNALHDAMKISMTMYNTSDSSQVWSDTLIARTSYDLEPIFKLFAEHIGTAKKASEEGNSYSVEKYNPKELNKVDASINFGVSISRAYSMINRVKNKTSKGLGFIASYDSKHYIIDIQGDFLRGDVLIYDIRISGLYPLITSKCTPFIGGSIALSGVTFFYPNPNPNPKSYFTEERGDGIGLAMYVNGGYLFCRNWNVKFRLTGSFIFPFYKTVTSPFYKRETQKPLGFMINSAILI